MKFILLLLLLLTSCGLGTNIDALPVYQLQRAEKVWISFGQVGDGLAGQTSMSGKNAYITIKFNETYNELQYEHVITHEFFHALGYFGHIQHRDDCFFSWYPIYALKEPCDEDVRLIQALSDEIKTEVYVVPELRDYTIVAINRINNIKNILTLKD